MNTCSNCGKATGLHSSILQGCMCQYSMQAQSQRTWVGLTRDEVLDIEETTKHPLEFYQAIEAKLKEKNT